MLDPTYPIETERLLLRPLVDDDLDALHSMHSREDVTRYLYWGPRSRAEIEELLSSRKSFTKLESAGEVLVLGVVLKDGGHLIGELILKWISQEHMSGEIGFAFHPDYHGRGYGYEGGLEMLRLGFEGLRLHRIVGRCDGRNGASAGLMEKLGMRREAHLVQNEMVKGEWTDELIYAMLDHEWSAKASS